MNLNSWLLLALKYGTFNKRMINVKRDPATRRLPYRHHHYYYLHSSSPFTITSIVKCHFLTFCNLSEHHDQIIRHAELKIIQNRSCCGTSCAWSCGWAYLRHRILYANVLHFPSFSRKTSNILVLKIGTDLVGRPVCRM